MGTKTNINKLDLINLKIFSTATNDKWKSLSCVRLFVTPYSPWSSPGQSTEVGSLPLLQGIFPTQGLNPGLPHCRWIIYQLSHKGSPAKETINKIRQPTEWKIICANYETNKELISRIYEQFIQLNIKCKQKNEKKI